MPAEQDNSSGNVRIKAEFVSFFCPVHRDFVVKLLFHHHARGKKNMVSIVAMLERLLLGALGPADQVLGLPLNPEMRRIIGEVGK